MALRLGLTLLLVSISSATEYQSVSPSIRPYSHKKVDVGVGYSFCFLPCAVQATSNRSLINPPFVSWEHLDLLTFAYVPLKNAMHWQNYNGGLFFNHYPTFCKYSTSGIYDCDLTISPCAERYRGEYKCNVYDFDSSSMVTRRVTLELGGLKDTFERCEDPIPILNATLVSHNGSLSVNFSWTFAPLQDENATFCHHMLSVRSFQSSAPYDLEDKMEPPHGGQRYTMLDQQAHHHIFDNINRVTYYQFELRIQSGLGTGNTKYYKHYSYLYYFGEQVPARVVEPVREHSVIRVHDGDPVTIPCEGAGTPSPTVLLLREVNVQPPQACSGCPVDKGNNIAAVSENDAGEYFCVAANTLVNPPLGKRTVRDWKSIILMVEPVAEPPSNVSQCLPYTHSTCGAFLDTDLLVFVDEGVNGDAGQLQLQEEVLSLFRRIDRRANRSEVSNLDFTLRSKCHRLAQSIACHSVYPYCYSNHQVPTPRLICKTTCDAFAAGGICEGFISEAETPELYARLAIKCDAREHPAGSNPECIPINLETAKIGHYNPIEHSWCAQGDGRSYAGPMRRTRSGLDCQSWSSQAPHKHPFWPSKYSPELISSVFACRNPGGVGEGPWCYTADPNIRWEYCEVPQCEVCQPYEGYGFCHGIEGYRDGNWTVYVDRSPSKWGPLGLDSVDQFLEGLLPRLTEDVGNETWSPGCDHAVRQLLCHATLPFCKKQEAAAPLMACSGCQLLDTIHFCSTIVYSRLVTELQRQSSRFIFQPDDCLATAAGSNFSGPDCMPPPQGLPSETDECYSSSDHGQSYTGQLAITERGERCQSWDEPHLLFHPRLYSELDGVANLCRNPGQLKDRIWCFTSKEAWDYCLVPINCSTVTAPAQASHQLTIFISIFAGIFVLFLCVFLGVVIFCCRKCQSNKQRRSRSPPLSLHSDTKACRSEKMVDNGSYVPLSVPRMADTLRRFRQVGSEIPRNDIHYIRQIGQGNFGVVFMGKMCRSTSSESDEGTIVAVKMLKDECQEALDDFAREARIMMQLDHPNIITMYGVTTDSSPYYLIFEYMDLGDLSKYLREHASSRQRRLMDPSGCRRSRTESTLSDDPPSLSPHQLADMCKQIAAGMEYLAAGNHVHRDLACRNCLVKSCTKADETSSGVIVKIGDFGMSHGLYQKNYYRVEGQAILPIRWMSPEAVIFGKFSTAGDVWSFGVTMWEIFSFAMQPYFGLSNEEVTKHIRMGRYLEKPIDCPDKIYTIMEMCWVLEPDGRPSFEELQNHINEIRNSLSSESSSNEGNGHHSPPTSIHDIQEEEEDNVFEDTPPEDTLHMMEMGHPPPSIVGGYRLNGDRFEYQSPQHLPPRLCLVGDDGDTHSSSSDSSNGSATESHA